MATGQIYYVDGSESTSSGTFTLYTPATGTQFLIVSYLVSYGTSGVSGNTITFAVGSAYLISAGAPSSGPFTTYNNNTKYMIDDGVSIVLKLSNVVTTTWHITLLQIL